MPKNKQIVVRVSIEQYNFIKAMGGSFSRIWQRGFDDWSREFPEFLQKKAKEYDNLYKQCIYKMQQCINNVYTKNKLLDELIKDYIESGRSLENPTVLDRNWLRSRLTKIDGVTIERFFVYANGKFNDDKQQLLEGVV